MGLFDGFAGAAVGALSGLTGSVLSNKQTAASTQAQMDFQERMSGTSYQRAVADLNAAGLSPMLAYSQGGASTPQGASYKAENIGAAATEGATKGSLPALTKAQIEVAKSQEQLNIQTAKQVAEQAKKTAIEVEQMPTRFYYDLGVLGSQINSNTAGAASSLANARNTTALAGLTEAGKAPSSDPTITRLTKDAMGAAGNAKSVLDDIISRAYKSIRGIK